MSTQVETNKIIIPNNDEDGIKFINIWFKGKTQVGRMLSHFYESPFIHPYFGPFNSMEGFWHYIQNVERDDALRSMSGMTAKNHGKKLSWHYVDNFHEIINTANFYKIEQNAELKKLVIESELPFTYYYLYEPTADAKGQPDVAITPPGYKWLIDGFEKNREMLKRGVRPEPLDYSSFSKKKNNK
jgi:hypothetical protein